MELLNDNYMTVEHDEENNIFIHVWKQSSDSLSDEDFRKQLITLKKLIVDKKPKTVCADTRQFLYTMPPETQEWVNEDFFGAIVPAGLKKYALMVSADIFTQVSVEQTVGEEDDQSFKSKYFDNWEEAIKWSIK